eukprot:Partr_v1_DN26050_c0_g1_i1_m276 putative Solute carrier family 38 member
MQQRSSKKMKKAESESSDTTLMPQLENAALLPVGSIDDISRVSVLDGDLASAGIPSSMINILNTILGTGMLAMPIAISSVGLIPGVFMIFLSGFFASTGLFLLSRCAEYVGRSSSFNSISLITYPGASIVFDLAIAVKCFGVGISYLVVIGDNMTAVASSLYNLPEGHLLLYRQFWISLFMVIIIPFSFVKRLDKLKYTSFVALISVVYFFILVIHYFIDPARVPPPPDTVKMFEPKLSFLSRLPIYVFAFTCHQNLFSVYNELKDNSPARINTITTASIFISACVYTVVGVLGYLMFGDHVKSNMLESFPASILITIARFAITLLVALSFPLQCHPSRASFDKVINTLTARFPALNGGRDSMGAYSPIVATVDQESTDESSVITHPFGVVKSRVAPPPVEMSEGRFIGITCVILLASYSIAFVTSELDKVLAFVGSTGSTTICYILPAIFYLKLKQNEPWSLLKSLAVLMLVVGLVTMPVCVTFIFM